MGREAEVGGGDCSYDETRHCCDVVETEEEDGP